MSGSLLPADYAAALTMVPAMTVHRLLALLGDQPPEEAWAVVRGRRRARGLVARVLHDDAVAAAWRGAPVDLPARARRQCDVLGLRVLHLGGPDYPSVFDDDPLPPPVLFGRGDWGLLGGRRVAVVGTRNATAAGRQAARELAGGLAASGIHVVSGLARGVDGAAHGAVVAARGPGRPIGVVASGLDVVYPREHRDLWQAVARDGLLLGESPPGTRPEAFRFPLRNRIVAALGEALVVVESRERGGSLITVDQALQRGRPVLAVPGLTTNRAAAGTNALLRDGAAPALDIDDVLASLCMPSAVVAMTERRLRPAGFDRQVYRLLAERPGTIDDVAAGCAATVVDAAVAIGRLQQAGWVDGADGWFETVGARLA